MLSLTSNEVWFVTGSQHLYGPETLEHVAEHAAVIAAALDDAPAIPVHVVVKPVLTGPDGIRQLMGEANASPTCVELIAWMHTLVLSLELSSSCDYWVVNDEPPETICLEPQSSPPDFVHLDPVIVTPRQPLTATMTWRWRTNGHGGEPLGFARPTG